MLFSVEKKRGLRCLKVLASDVCRLFFTRKTSGEIFDIKNMEEVFPESISECAGSSTF